MKVSEELMQRILIALDWTSFVHETDCVGEFTSCKGCDKYREYIGPVLDQLRKEFPDLEDNMPSCPNFKECNLEYGHSGSHKIVAG